MPDPQRRTLGDRWSMFYTHVGRYSYRPTNSFKALKEHVKFHFNMEVSIEFCGGKGSLECANLYVTNNY